MHEMSMRSEEGEEGEKFPLVWGGCVVELERCPDRQSADMGRVARAPCFTCGAIVFLFCASLLLCSSGPPPRGSRVLELAGSQPATPDVVVFTTHHKTGEPCLSRSLQGDIAPTCMRRLHVCSFFMRDITIPCMPGTVMAGCYSQTLTKRLKRLCQHTILTDYQV
jgi:hypothetical protein